VSTAVSDIGRRPRPEDFGLTEEHEGSVVDAMALDRLRMATVREADTGALP